MRFLKQTSPAHLRLGFLRVIASCVGLDRMPFDQLQKALLPWLDHSEAWIQNAGLAEAPGGNVGKSHVDRLARMGVNYGIHDEETTALTDLGHVLRVVAPWNKEAGNPLVWDNAARWVGFCIVVQAAGDVLLPLLRSWSTQELTSTEAAERLQDSLSALVQNARAERDSLRNQMEGASPKNPKFRARAILYPYIEPLRDLGYVERIKLVGGGPGYRLTEAGCRIGEALRRFSGDTEALLRSGISRVFLLGEGMGPLRPASGREFADVLARMPPELTVLRPEEVPLDAAVWLAQARLIHEAPGAWIDPRRAHDLLKAVGQRGAKVEVKRGGSVLEFNVAWESAAVLADHTLWDVNVDVDDPFTAIPKPAPNAVELSNPDVPAVSDEVEGDGASDVNDPPATSESQETVLSFNIDALLTPDVPTPLRLWLQYVDSLLAPPTVGAFDTARWGGLKTALARLEALRADLPADKLEEKRAKRMNALTGQKDAKPYCLHSLLCLEPSLREVKEDWIYRRTEEIWLDRQAWTNPHAMLTRGLGRAAGISHDLRKKLIDPFLDLSTEDKTIGRKWYNVREATRCILQDAIADGIGSSRSLRDRLHLEIGLQKPREAARCFLDVLFAISRDIRYIQRRDIPLDICQKLNLEGDTNGIEVKIRDETNDSGANSCKFILSVHARSDFEAKTKGHEAVHTFLTHRFAQKVSPDADTHVDLHHRIEDERVEPSDAKTIPDAQRGLFPGLSTARLKDIPDSDSAGRRIASASERVQRARRELLETRRPGLRDEQRVMLAWMTMERLIAAGLRNKGDTITSLAAVATLIHFRAMFARVLHDARAGLWLSACLAPNEFRPHVEVWLDDLSEDERALLHIDVLESIRTKRVMDPMAGIDGEKALRRLWPQRPKVIELHHALTAWAPLAATGLYWFLKVTGRESDNSTMFQAVGNGKELGKCFRDLYDEIASFFAHVYEIRNRAAHGEGALQGGHNPSATQIYHRFLILTEPVLDAAERWDAQRLTLEQGFGLAFDKAHDLAGIHHAVAKDESLELERFVELLDV